MSRRRRRIPRWNDWPENWVIAVGMAGGLVFAWAIEQWELRLRGRIFAGMVEHALHSDEL